MPKKRIHVVAAVILNKRGEILCAKRSQEMILPNYWEFPGGKVEQGETNFSALTREIKEELQCDIEIFNQIADTTYEYESFIVRLETFWTKIRTGNPIKGEHAQLKWLPPNQLSKLNFAPADLPTVKEVIQQCTKEYTNK